jgi:hypothetical protein
LTYSSVLDWMFGFIDTLYTPLGTTGNYSAIAVLHTLQFAVTHTSVLSLLHSPLVVSWQRIKSHINSSLHCLLPFLPLFSIIFDCRFSQFIAATANFGTRLNSNSSCLRSSLYSLGTDPRKTPLPLLLLVDSLLQRCVYHIVAQQRARRKPTENAACNTYCIIT